MVAVAVAVVVVVAAAAAVGYSVRRRCFAAAAGSGAQCTAGRVVGICDHWLDHSMVDRLVAIASPYPRHRVTAFFEKS